MSDVIATASNDLFLSQDLAVCCETLITFYGTINDADTYFCSRLRSEAWETASISDKRKALIMATRAIDRLNFVGKQAVAGQTHQFPRDSAISVPAEIKIACYEEAYNLLDGVDIEAAQANLSAVAQGFSSVRTTYDRTWVPDNIRAGISSYTAWNCLLPYLRDPHEVIVSRV